MFLQFVFAVTLEMFIPSSLVTRGTAVLEPGEQVLVLSLPTEGKMAESCYICLTNFNS